MNESPKTLTPEEIRALTVGNEIMIAQNPAIWRVVVVWPSGVSLKLIAWADEPMVPVPDRFLEWEVLEARGVEKLV